MKSVLIIGAIGLGVAIIFHSLMNANVGVISKNNYMANMVFWWVGAIAASVLGFLNWDQSFFEEAKNIPKWLFLAGTMGTMITLFSNYMIPLLGIFSFTILVLFGQIISSMLFSHYGVLDDFVGSINNVKIVGAVLTFVGASLVVYGKIPFLGEP